MLVKSWICFAVPSRYALVKTLTKFGVLMLVKSWIYFAVANMYVLVKNLTKFGVLMLVKSWKSWLEDTRLSKEICSWGSFDYNEDTRHVVVLVKSWICFAVASRLVLVKYLVCDSFSVHCKFERFVYCNFIYY